MHGRERQLISGMSLLVRTETFVDGQLKAWIGGVLVDAHDALTRGLVPEQLRLAERAEVVPAPGDHGVRLLGDDARQVHGLAGVGVHMARSDEDLLIDSRTRCQAQHRYQTRARRA